MERVKRSRIEKNKKILELRESIKTEVASLMLGFAAIDDRKNDCLEKAKLDVLSLKKEKITKNKIDGKTIIAKAQVKLTEEEQKQALIEFEKIIENEINSQKQELENQIIKVIRDNSKFILFSKSNRDVYKYYIATLENPLSGKFANIELNIIKKYIAMNKYLNDELKSHLGIHVKHNGNSNNNNNNNNNVNKKIAKINEYLEKALVENNLEILEEAKTLIDELESEELKTDVSNKLQEVTKKINEFKEKEKQEKLQNATILVEKAEESKLKEDVDAARDVVNALDFSFDSANLASRLDSIVISKVEEFERLLRKINNDIDAHNDIRKDEIIELRNLYQTLTKKQVADYKNAICLVNEIYNDQKQDELKKSIDEEKIQKHSLFSIFTELLSNSYLLKSDKINNRKLTKQEKKLQRINELLDKEDNEKKKEIIEKVKTRKEAKIEKIKERIADSDIISGVKLFMLRNKINKLKPKLYKNDITEKQEVKLHNSLCKFTNKLSKGLNKRIDKGMQFIKTDKQRVTNVLDQYIELLSATDDFDNTYSDATNFLETIEAGVLTESEINAYKAQFSLIKNYRSDNILDDEGFLNLKSIYESDLNETDKMVKYYDEEYPKQNNKLRYISK